MLSKKAITRFKRIYKRKFKVNLNDKEAFRKANKLLNLYRAVYGFNPPNQRKENQPTNSG